MSEFNQPWRRVDLDGRRCRLQILDPRTAFDIEASLVETLGETLSFACAAPSELLGAVWVNSTGGAQGPGIHDMIRDPFEGPAMAVDAIQTLGMLLSRCIADAQLDPAWVRQMFSAMVMGRLQVEGELIEDSRDWMDARFRWRAKWDVMAAQLRQTFGPLWTRSPYKHRIKSTDYGVPRPTDVPMAVAWADNLAQRGSAPSSHEILHVWTPVRMIEIVENAAYQAAQEQRAHEVARAGDR